jgi:hypothetical protein
MIYSDTSDSGPLFFNPLTSLPLRLSESLRMLSGMLTTFQTQLADMGVSVASLQSRLASTNQNDIALALRSLQAVVNALQVAQNTRQNPGPPLLPARSPPSPFPPARPACQRRFWPPEAPPPQPSPWLAPPHLPCQS